jgi:hypothetical protein
VSEAPSERLDYEVFPLSLLLQERFGNVSRIVKERLAAFNCKRSPHIQEFARGAVHRWEKHGHSRTYVLLTGEVDFQVPGFFTVGMTSLDFSRASRRTRERLMGDISMEQTGAFSIAELARSDDFTNAQLPGSVILDEAKAVISRARAWVGGRFLVVDSRQEIFDRLYQPAGFKQIDVATPPIGMEDTSFVTSCAVIKDWGDPPATEQVAGGAT